MSSQRFSKSQKKNSKKRAAKRNVRTAKNESPQTNRPKTFVILATLIATVTIVFCAYLRRLDVGRELPTLAYLSVIAIAFITGICVVLCSVQLEKWSRKSAPASDNFKFPTSYGVSAPAKSEAKRSVIVLGG